jgi:hypothetical protein
MTREQTKISKKPDHTFIHTHRVDLIPFKPETESTNPKSYKLFSFLAISKALYSPIFLGPPESLPPPTSAHTRHRSSGFTASHREAKNAGFDR